MSVYIKSDFSNANSVLDALKQEYNDANSLITSIKNFKSNSILYLKGSVGDMVIDKLDTYISALEKRKNNSEILYNNISTVNNSLIDVLGSFDLVRTDRLEELLAEQRKYNMLMEEIRNKIVSIEQRKMLVLPDINYINDYINTIKNVSKTANEGTKTLSSSAGNNTAYAAEVNNIVPSNSIDIQDI